MATVAMVAGTVVAMVTAATGVADMVVEATVAADTDLLPVVAIVRPYTARRFIAHPAIGRRATPRLAATGNARQLNS